MTKRYGANISPCKTLARILKVSVSPSGVMTLAVVPSYIMLIANTPTPPVSHNISVSHAFSLYVSNALLNSMNISIAFRLLSLTLSISPLRTNI